jgi:hypothetical protein
MKHADILHELLTELFGGKNVLREHTVGNNLRLDFYIPDFNLAAEYQGAQHDRYISFFHEDKADFYIAQNRDEQKLFACQQLGINLIYFFHTDKLSLDLVKKRYNEVGPGSGEIVDRKFLSNSSKRKSWIRCVRKKNYERYKTSELYKEKLKQAREWRRKQKPGK